MAGSISVSSRNQIEIGKGDDYKRIEQVVVAWTADASDGSLPVLSVELRGYLIKAVTNPGSVAPTANYDITLADPEDSALDAAASLLLNRHTSTTEQVYPLISGAACPILLVGTYGLTITNNSVNSATGRILLYLSDGF